MITLLFIWCTIFLKKNLKHSIKYINLLVVEYNCLNFYLIAILSSNNDNFFYIISISVITHGVINLD